MYWATFLPSAGCELAAERRSYRGRPLLPSSGYSEAPPPRSRERGNRETEIMDGLGIPVTGVPFVAFTPPSVVQHQAADWSAIRADNVEGVRHEAFDFVVKATSHHLLLAAERAEWYDGESFVDGLPKSHVRVWNQTLTFVPAGSRYHGWKKPRTLTRGTFLYIDPQSSLLQS